METTQKEKTSNDKVARVRSRAHDVGKVPCPFPFAGSIRRNYSKLVHELNLECFLSLTLISKNKEE